MNGCRATIVLGGLLAVGACKEDGAASAVEGAADAAEGVADAAAGEPGPDESPMVAKAPEPPEPPPSGHAVAKVGSLLFFSSTGQVGFELPPLGHGSAAAPGMTVNVTGEHDGRLVVETLVAQPAEHHCAATASGLSDFRLRLYLEAHDLLPVLTDDFEHEHADGTKVRLTRGVPVPEGSRELLVRGTSVRVASVPSDALGRFYEPSQPLSADDRKDVLPTLDGHALTYGGHVLDEAELFRHDGALAHFGSTPRGAEALVTVRNPCLEITALVSDARIAAATPSVAGGVPGGVAGGVPGGVPGGILGVMEHDSGHFLASPYGSAFAADEGEDVWGGLTGTEIGEAYGVGSLGLVGTGKGRGAKPTYEVKAGVAIVWPDGSPAGQVTADHRFTVDPRDEGGRTCFDAAILEAEGPTVTLCFAPGDVAKHEPPPSALGVGGLGISGTGVGGSGSGYGTGGGYGSVRRGKAPMVRQAKATVVGSLDKDIIRRIVRAHLNEVRYCYNQGLARDPSLAGKVEVRFTISPSGKVSTADIHSTTLSDTNATRCIAKAVKRWAFPKPTGGGVVLVTYPFVLEPG